MNKASVISFGIFAAVVIVFLWAINKYTKQTLMNSVTTAPQTDQYGSGSIGSDFFANGGFSGL